MEIPRDFPGGLSRKKNGSKTSIRALPPPWNFLKVDRYDWATGAPIYTWKKYPSRLNLKLNLPTAYIQMKYSNELPHQDLQ